MLERLKRARAVVPDAVLNVGNSNSAEEHQKGRDYLEDVTKLTGSRAFLFNWFDQNPALITQLIRNELLKPDYTLSADLSSTLRAPYRVSIRVRVKRSGLQVLSRRTAVLKPEKKKN